MEEQMPIETPNPKTTTPDVASQVTEKLGDAASAAKSSASNLGRTAVAKADENRDAAAQGLASAASTLHDKADSLPGGTKVADLAHTAADTLGSTADYVRDHDVNSMLHDVEQMVKNYPGPSMLAAAVIGFLVGRTFSSSD
jgi:ElaB/YqjD/DUF883 family membrane-anchored ribosome-binding protein